MVDSIGNTPYLALFGGDSGKVDVRLKKRRMTRCVSWMGSGLAHSGI